MNIIGSTNMISPPVITHNAVERSRVIGDEKENASGSNDEGMDEKEKITVSRGAFEGSPGDTPSSMKGGETDGSLGCGENGEKENTTGDCGRDGKTENTAGDLEKLPVSSHNLNNIALFEKNAVFTKLNVDDIASETTLKCQLTSDAKLKCHDPDSTEEKGVPNTKTINENDNSFLTCDDKINSCNDLVTRQTADISPPKDKLHTILNIVHPKQFENPTASEQSDILAEGDYLSLGENCKTDKEYSTKEGKTENTRDKTQSPTSSQKSREIRNLYNNTAHEHKNDTDSSSDSPTSSEKCVTKSEDIKVSDLSENASSDPANKLDSSSSEEIIDKTSEATKDLAPKSSSPLTPQTSLSSKKRRKCGSKSGSGEQRSNKTKGGSLDFTPFIYEQVESSPGNGLKVKYRRKSADVTDNPRATESAVDSVKKDDASSVSSNSAAAGVNSKGPIPYLKRSDRRKSGSCGNLSQLSKVTGASSNSAPSKESKRSLSEGECELDACVLKKDEQSSVLEATILKPNVHSSPDTNDSTAAFVGKIENGKIVLHCIVKGQDAKVDNVQICQVESRVKSSPTLTDSSHDTAHTHQTTLVLESSSSLSSSPLLSSTSTLTSLPSSSSTTTTTTSTKTVPSIAPPSQLPSSVPNSFSKSVVPSESVSTQSPKLSSHLPPSVNHVQIANNNDSRIIACESSDESTSVLPASCDEQDTENHNIPKKTPKVVIRKLPQEIFERYYYLKHETFPVEPEYSSHKQRNRDLEISPGLIFKFKKYSPRREQYKKRNRPQKKHVSVKKPKPKKSGKTKKLTKRPSKGQGPKSNSEDERNAGTPDGDQVLPNGATKSVLIQESNSSSSSLVDPKIISMSSALLQAFNREAPAESIAFNKRPTFKPPKGTKSFKPCKPVSQLQKAFHQARTKKRASNLEKTSGVKTNKSNKKSTDERTSLDMDDNFQTQKESKPVRDNSTLHLSCERSYKHSSLFPIAEREIVPSKTSKRPKYKRKISCPEPGHYHNSSKSTPLLDRNIFENDLFLEFNKITASSSNDKDTFLEDKLTLSRRRHKSASNVTKDTDLMLKDYSTLVISQNEANQDNPDSVSEMEYLPKFVDVELEIGQSIIEHAKHWDLEASKSLHMGEAEAREDFLPTEIPKIEISHTISVTADIPLLSPVNTKQEYLSEQHSHSMLPTLYAEGMEQQQTEVNSRTNGTDAIKTEHIESSDIFASCRPSNFTSLSIDCAQPLDLSATNSKTDECNQYSLVPSNIPLSMNIPEIKITSPGSSIATFGQLTPISNPPSCASLSPFLSPSQPASGHRFRSLNSPSRSGGKRNASHYTGKPRPLCYYSPSYNRAARRENYQEDSHESDDSDATVVYPKRSKDKTHSSGLGHCETNTSQVPQSHKSVKQEDYLSNFESELEKCKNELSSLVSDIRQNVAKHKAMKRSRRTNSFSGENNSTLPTKREQMDTLAIACRPGLERFISVEPLMDSATPYKNMSRDAGHDNLALDGEQNDQNLLDFVTMLNLQTENMKTHVVDTGSDGTGSEAETKLYDMNFSHLKSQDKCMNSSRPCFSKTKESDDNNKNSDGSTSTFSPGSRLEIDEEGDVVDDDVQVKEAEQPDVVIENAESDHVILGKEAMEKMRSGKFQHAERSGKRFAKKRRKRSRLHIPITEVLLPGDKSPNGDDSVFDKISTLPKHFKHKRVKRSTRLASSDKEGTEGSQLLFRISNESTSTSSEDEDTSSQPPIKAMLSPGSTGSGNSLGVPSRRRIHSDEIRSRSLSPGLASEAKVLKPKRGRKAKIFVVDDPITEHLSQSSTARILQELPRFNWLEQKILQQSSNNSYKQTTTVGSTATPTNTTTTTTSSTAATSNNNNNNNNINNNINNNNNNNNSNHNNSSGNSSSPSSYHRPPQSNPFPHASNSNSIKNHHHHHHHHHIPSPSSSSSSSSSSTRFRSKGGDKIRRSGGGKSDTSTYNSSPPRHHDQERIKSSSSGNSNNSNNDNRGGGIAPFKMATTMATPPSLKLPEDLAKTDSPPSAITSEEGGKRSPPIDGVDFETGALPSSVKNNPASCNSKINGTSSNDNTLNGEDGETTLTTNNNNNNSNNNNNNNNSNNSDDSSNNNSTNINSSAKEMIVSISRKQSASSTDGIDSKQATASASNGDDDGDVRLSHCHTELDLNIPSPENLTIDLGPSSLELEEEKAASDPPKTGDATPTELAVKGDKECDENESTGNEDGVNTEDENVIMVFNLKETCGEVPVECEESPRRPNGKQPSFESTSASSPSASDFTDNEKSDGSHSPTHMLLSHTTNEDEPVPVPIIAGDDKNAHKPVVDMDSKNVNNSSEMSSSATENGQPENGIVNDSPTANDEDVEMKNVSEIESLQETSARLDDATDDITVLMVTDDQVPPIENNSSSTSNTGIVSSIDGSSNAITITPTTTKSSPGQSPAIILSPSSPSSTSEFQDTTNSTTTTFTTTNAAITTTSSTVCSSDTTTTTTTPSHPPNLSDVPSVTDMSSSAPLDLCLKRSDNSTSSLGTNGGGASRVKTNLPVQMVLPQPQTQTGTSTAVTTVTSHTPMDVAYTTWSGIDQPKCSDIEETPEKLSVQSNDPLVPTLTKDLKDDGQCYIQLKSLDLSSKMTIPPLTTTDCLSPLNLSDISRFSQDSAQDLSVRVGLTPAPKLNNASDLSMKRSSNDESLTRASNSPQNVSQSGALDVTASSVVKGETTKMTDAELEKEFHKHLIEYRALEKLAERKSQEQIQIGMLRKRKAEILRYYDAKRKKKTGDRGNSTTTVASVQEKQSSPKSSLPPHLSLHSVNGTPYASASQAQTTPSPSSPSSSQLYNGTGSPVEVSPNLPTVSSSEKESNENSYAPKSTTSPDIINVDSVSIDDSIQRQHLSSPLALTVVSESAQSTHSSSTVVSSESVPTKAHQKQPSEMPPFTPLTSPSRCVTSPTITGPYAKRNTILTEPFLHRRNSTERGEGTFQKAHSQKPFQHPGNFNISDAKSKSDSAFNALTSSPSTPFPPTAPSLIAVGKHSKPQSPEVPLASPNSANKYPNGVPQFPSLPPTYRPLYSPNEAIGFHNAPEHYSPNGMDPQLMNRSRPSIGPAKLVEATTGADVTRHHAENIDKRPEDPHSNYIPNSIKDPSQAHMTTAASSSREIKRPAPGPRSPPDAPKRHARKTVHRAGSKDHPMEHVPIMMHPTLVPPAPPQITLPPPPAHNSSSSSAATRDDHNKLLFRHNPNGGKMQRPPPPDYSAISAAPLPHPDHQWPHGAPVPFHPPSFPSDKNVIVVKDNPDGLVSMSQEDIMQNKYRESSKPVGGGLMSAHPPHPLPPDVIPMPPTNSSTSKSTPNPHSPNHYYWSQQPPGSSRTATGVYIPAPQGVSQHRDGQAHLPPPPPPQPQPQPAPPPPNSSSSQTSHQQQPPPPSTMPPHSSPYAPMHSKRHQHNIYQQHQQQQQHQMQQHHQKQQQQQYYMQLQHHHHQQQQHQQHPDQLLQVPHGAPSGYNGQSRLPSPDERQPPPGYPMAYTPHGQKMRHPQPPHQAPAPAAPPPPPPSQHHHHHHQQPQHQPPQQTPLPRPHLHTQHRHPKQQQQQQQPPVPPPLSHQSNAPVHHSPHSNIPPSSSSSYQRGMPGALHPGMPQPTPQQGPPPPPMSGENLSASVYMGPPGSGPGPSAMSGAPVSRMMGPPPKWITVDGPSRQHHPSQPQSTFVPVPLSLALRPPHSPTHPPQHPSPRHHHHPQHQLQKQQQQQQQHQQQQLLQKQLQPPPSSSLSLSSFSPSASSSACSSSLSLSSSSQTLTLSSASSSSSSSSSSSLPQQQQPPTTLPAPSSNSNSHSHMKDKHPPHSPPPPPQQSQQQQPPLPPQQQQQQRIPRHDEPPGPPQQPQSKKQQQPAPPPSLPLQQRGVSGPQVFHSHPPPPSSSSLHPSMTTMLSPAHAYTGSSPRDNINNPPGHHGFPPPPSSSSTSSSSSSLPSSTSSSSSSSAPSSSSSSSSSSSGVSNSLCHLCGKMAAFLCSNCRRVWYCNEQCQSKHWSVHAAECKPIAGDPHYN